MQMLVSMFVSPTIFILVLEYIGQGQRLTRRNLALVLAVPIIGVFFVLSSPYHQLFHYNFQLDLSSPFPIMLAD